MEPPSAWNTSYKCNVQILAPRNRSTSFESIVSTHFLLYCLCLPGVQLRGNLLPKPYLKTWMKSHLHENQARGLRLTTHKNLYIHVKEARTYVDKHCERKNHNHLHYKFVISFLFLILFSFFFF